MANLDYKEFLRQKKKELIGTGFIIDEKKAKQKTKRFPKVRS